MPGKEKKTTNPLWITLGMIHPEWVYLPPILEEEVEEEVEPMEKETAPTEQQIRIHFRQRKEDKAP